jgi:hypothetical protein
MKTNFLQIVEAVSPGAGGDYHTTYWPQVNNTFLCWNFRTIYED